MESVKNHYKLKVCYQHGYTFKRKRMLDCSEISTEESMAMLKGCSINVTARLPGKEKTGF